jgi:hypothetical protein
LFVQAPTAAPTEEPTAAPTFEPTMVGPENGRKGGPRAAMSTSIDLTLSRPGHANRGRDPSPTDPHGGPDQGAHGHAHRGADGGAHPSAHCVPQAFGGRRYPGESLRATSCPNQAPRSQPPLNPLFVSSGLTVSDGDPDRVAYGLPDHRAHGGAHGGKRWTGWRRGMLPRRCFHDTGIGGQPC